MSTIHVPGLTSHPHAQPHGASGAVDAPQPAPKLPSLRQSQISETRIDAPKAPLPNVLRKTGTVALGSTNRTAPPVADSGDEPTQVPTPSTDENRQCHVDEATDLKRRDVGRFLSPAKKAIRHFSGTPIGAVIKQSLDDSDLAHRMSFEDIRRCVASNPINSKPVQDMIRALTIPARDYGGVPEGDRQ